MTRKQLLKSKEYWFVQMQMHLYEVVSKYMSRTGKTNEQMCEKLDISQRTLKKIRDGEWDNTIHEYISILLACDKVPVIRIENLKDQK